MLSRAFEGPRWLGFLSRILMTASTPHYWVLKYTHTVSHVNPFVHSMHVFCSVGACVTKVGFAGFSGDLARFVLFLSTISPFSLKNAASNFAAGPGDPEDADACALFRGRPTIGDPGPFFIFIFISIFFLFFIGIEIGPSTLPKPYAHSSSPAERGAREMRMKMKMEMKMKTRTRIGGARTEQGQRNPLL